MSTPSPIALTGIFLVIIGVLSGLPYLKGGLFLDSHEADVYHLLDISFRMTDGQMPHLDFATPLGILAFSPIVAFLKAGLPFGAAFMASQLSLALLLLPFVVYAASSRLPYRQSAVFGGIVFALVLILTYLQASSGVTVAMHYNRWSWAVAFVALLLAFVPPQGVARPKLDGVLIGVLAFALMLTKMTFFVALVPAMVAVLFVRKQRVAVGVALGVGVALIALTIPILGVDFWNAYVADLLNVTGSDVRPHVGLPLGEMVSGAQYIGATLTGVAAAML
ncbi:MAG: hypothetical protein ABJ074_00020, partial [Paracoccaceae bacterium]